MISVVDVTCLFEAPKTSELSKTPKDKYCMIQLMETPRRLKFIRTERTILTKRGWGGEGGVVVL